MISRRACSQSAADGRIVHLNSTLAQWLASAARIGQAADACGYRVGGRCGADPRRRPRRTRHHGSNSICCARTAVPSPRTSSAAVTGPAASSPSWCSTGLPRASPTGRVRGREAHLTRLLQAAPFGIATVDGGRPHRQRQCRLHAHVLHRGARRASERCRPRCRAATSARAASWPRRCSAPYSGRAGAGPGRDLLRPTARVRAPHLREPARHRRAGRATGAILYAIDATEQKALELKFAQSHKMEAVGQLAGGVAHDFNNVLTAIIGFSDLLLQTHRPTDPAYRDIMNIKSSANRAAGLVRQLLAFSRRQTLQAEVLELGELLTDLSALLNKALGEKIDAQDPARPRPVAREGRQDAVRARHHQPGGQRQGCHARRRPPHHPHAQRLRAREPEARRSRRSPPASTCWSRWRTRASASRRT